MRYLVCFATSLIFSAQALCQNNITYTRSEGLNWIKAKNTPPAFTMRPLRPISDRICKTTFSFLDENGLVTACKENLISCDPEFLADVAPKYAFGIGFQSSRKPDMTSMVNWLIMPYQTNSLNPELIAEYAAQLGIDPSESVVESIDGSDLAAKMAVDLPIRFMPYKEGEIGGNSWYFRHVVKMLLRKDEDIDLEKKIYFNKPELGGNTIQLVSRFLNCELQSQRDDFVELPFRNYTVNGLKAVSAEQGREVFDAAQSILGDQMPAGSSELDKALMYGFHLATMIKGETIQKIGMSTVIGKVFDTTGGTVKVKPYATAEEMTEALRVVASYTQEGGYIKLTPEQGD